MNLAPKQGGRRSVIAWIGVLLCLAGFLSQRLPLPWPRHVGFLFVAGMMVFGNLFWWTWVDALLLEVMTTRRASSAFRRVVRGAWGGYMIATMVPVFLLMVKRQWWDAWPPTAIAWVMTWNLLLAILTAVASVGMLVSWLWRRIVRRARKPVPLSDTPTKESVDLSRRRLLLGAASAPFAISAAAVTIGKLQEGRFVVRRITMKLPRLPDRLRGLTIAHVSDLHTGRLFRPEHLPRMIDGVNALKCDIVAVTGDIIDHSNDFLPAACDALAALEHRYGRYVVMGNHDLIDDSRAFLSYIEPREKHFLIDEHRRIEIGGETLQIAGLGWSGSDEKNRGDPGHARRAGAALAKADMERFTLALVHHPHAFDALAARGVDLTLAGHTHGGQLMLTPPGSPVRIGAGSLMFRYLWGEYYRGSSALYVNAGVGNWFPLRLNAPAEIVQIQLV